MTYDLSRDVSWKGPEAAAVDVAVDVAWMSRLRRDLSRVLSRSRRVGSPDQHTTGVGLCKGPAVAVSWSPGFVDSGWSNLIDNVLPLAQVSRVPTEDPLCLIGGQPATSGSLRVLLGAGEEGGAELAAQRLSALSPPLRLHWWAIPGALARCHALILTMPAASSEPDRDSAVGERGCHAGLRILECSTQVRDIGRQNAQVLRALWALVRRLEFISNNPREDGRVAERGADGRVLGVVRGAVLHRTDVHISTRPDASTDRQFARNALSHSPDTAARAATLLADLVEPAKSTALEKLGEGNRALRVATSWLRAKVVASESPTITAE